MCLEYCDTSSKACIQMQLSKTLGGQSGSGYQGLVMSVGPTGCEEVMNLRSENLMCCLEYCDTSGKACTQILSSKAL